MANFCIVKETFTLVFFHLHISVNYDKVLRLNLFKMVMYVILVELINKAFKLVAYM